jgi:murein DD-endopeptidase MepM/ murein hydrolase activator NlpD
LILTASPAAASSTKPKPGEGVIAITTRVCWSSRGWQQVAAANHITGPTYLVRLGQTLVVHCPGRTTGKASRSTPRVGGWQLPLNRFSLTSCYGMRWGALHRGIDMAAPTGTPIHAIGSGTVVAAGWHWRGYGIEVIIRHSNGVFSHYAHQSREIVHVGQTVSRGQTIGYVGATGDATGPHLHLEVMSSAAYGHQVNPAVWLRARGVKVGGC